MNILNIKNWPVGKPWIFAWLFVSFVTPPWWYAISIGPLMLNFYFHDILVQSLACQLLWTSILFVYGAFCYAANWILQDPKLAVASVQLMEIGKSLFDISKPIGKHLWFGLLYNLVAYAIVTFLIYVIYAIITNLRQRKISNEKS